MTLAALQLRFRDVSDHRRSTKDVDGNRVLTVGAGDLGAHPRVLRMVFETGRIGPHHLRVSGATELRRVRPAPPTDHEGGPQWTPAPGEYTWDALIPHGQAEIKVSWLEPYEGARIVRLGESSLAQSVLDSPDQPAQEWYDAGANTDLDAYRDACKQVDAAPDEELSALQKQAARFWLSLDACTSLADPCKDGPGLAHELRIDPELLSVDPMRRKWMTNVLKQRWMTRAACSAAGIPFELVFYEFQGDAWNLAVDVAELVHALLDVEFKGQFDADAREAVAQFACGRLRRPQVGERLNVEPNSFNMASFAELFDLASVTNGNTPGTKLEQRAGLRTLFVAMIEPFVEIYVYRDPDEGPDLNASGYKFGNLGIDPGKDVCRDWPGDRLKQHIAHVDQLPPDELRRHWSAVLQKALANEDLVKDAAEWRRANPDPTDGSAWKSAASLIERRLRATTERADENDAGA